MGLKSRTTQLVGAVLAVACIGLLNCTQVRAGGAELRTTFAPAQVDKLRFVTYSPDGKTLAALGQRENDDKVVRLLDAETGKLKGTLVHPDFVHSVIFSPDGKTLASVAEQTVRLWDLATAKEKVALEGLKENAPEVAFSPDSKFLAWGGGVVSNGRITNARVEIWDIAGGKEKASFTGEKLGYVVALAFAPDGQALNVVCSDWGRLRLWDATREKSKPLFKQRSSAFCSTAFSPDGKVLALGDLSDAVVLYDLALGTQKKAFEDTSFPGASLAFSPDGKTLACGNFGSIQLRDMPSGKERIFHTGQATSDVCIAFSPDGKTLAGFSHDQALKLWDTATGAEKAPLPGHTNAIYSVIFSPDGKTLASGSLDQTIKLWDITAGKLKTTFNVQENAALTLAFSPDGKALAGCGGFYLSNVAQVWNLETGKADILPRDGRHIFNGIAFSPDGKTIAAASMGEITLWDPATGTVRDRIKKGFGLLGFAAFIAYSPDGKTLASLDGPGAFVLDIRDAATGANTASFEHPIRATSLAFSPDGKILVTGDNEASVCLVNLAIGKISRICRGHTGPIMGVAFSPDGSNVASAGSDKTVRLWEAASGKELNILKGSKSRVMCVAFSPDGKLLASGEEDGTMRLWDLKPDSAGKK
jgi:WD40 repeat protein